MGADEPGLYGLTPDNTSRTGEDLWGKNQFNSTFPLALCLKMRDDQVPPVYVSVQKENKIKSSVNQLKMEDIIGKSDEPMYYAFETTFQPYESFSRESLEKIDLVVLKDGQPFLPLEIKLTVVPDATTVHEHKNKWAPEMVVRPVSSSYAMMSVVKRLKGSGNKQILTKAKACMRQAYDKITSNGWENPVEINKKKWDLVDSFSDFLKIITPVQSPYLVQPIWRTNGQSLELCERCFDVFVWSDAAIMAINLEPFSEEIRRAGNEDDAGSDRVSRHLREIARHVRAFWELCAMGSFSYQATYGGMPLGNQTDKSFSISGKKTRKYLDHARLRKPYYQSSILPEIILNGGESLLKPERRFDAAVVADALKR